jgi:CubicO group peptidase (beta-lactamase class C family)
VVITWAADDPGMDRRRLLGGGGAALLAAWVGGGCGGSESRRSPEDQGGDLEGEGGGAYVPGDGEWEAVDAEEVGWSASGLDEVMSLVGEEHSTSLVVLVGGRIVTERYWGSTDAETARDIASCQKSVVSTLCGGAGELGLLDLDEAVASYLGAGWAEGDEGEVTVRHLLTMTSGLDPRTLQRRARPGTRWRYNTAAYQKLRLVLEEVAAQPIEGITRSWLFDPIGVSERSAGGERRSGAWGLSMTARDLARFGLLVQRRGTWGDEQVVPTSWFDEALAPSQDMNTSYGYLWWLLGRPDADDLVAALGAKDQKLYICPSRDFVVVRQGGEASSSTFGDQLIDRILAAAR